MSTVKSRLAYHILGLIYSASNPTDRIVQLLVQDLIKYIPDLDPEYSILFAKHIKQKLISLN